MDRSIQPDYLFKMVIVGDMFVGKTSILVRYTNNSFDGIYKSTIGCDFLTKSVEMNGKNISLQMWDTSGQERFQALSSSFYRNADGLIIVYDVTNMESFQKVPRWLKQANYYSGKHPIQEQVLIGNKTDLTTERVVDYNTAQKFAQSLGLTYIETSAKDDTNVTQAFTSLTERLLNTHGYMGRLVEDRNTVKLEDGAHEVSEYSGYCCSYF